MDSESVINFLEKGGSITTDELRQYLQSLEYTARINGIESYKRFLLERVKQGRCKKLRRLDYTYGQIVLDTNEYLYKLRRLRNGQELEGDPDEQGDTSDKRYQGREKIKI